MRSPISPIQFFCANCDTVIPASTASSSLPIRPSTTQSQVNDQSSISSASSGHLSRSSTPPTEVSSTLSSPTFAPPIDTEEILRRRQQSDTASAEIGKRMLRGWAMLADECPNNSCYGIPLIRPPKAGGEKNPRKECVICGTVYVDEQDHFGGTRLIPLSPPTHSYEAGSSQTAPTPSDISASSSYAGRPADSKGKAVATSHIERAQSSFSAYPAGSSALDSSAQSLELSLHALSERLKVLVSGAIIDPSLIAQTADAITKVSQALAQVRHLQRNEVLFTGNTGESNSTDSNCGSYAPTGASVGICSNLDHSRLDADVPRRSTAYAHAMFFQFKPISALCDRVARKPHVLHDVCYMDYSTHELRATAPRGRIRGTSMLTMGVTPTMLGKTMHMTSAGIRVNPSGLHLPGAEPFRRNPRPVEGYAWFSPSTIPDYYGEGEVTTAAFTLTPASAHIIQGFHRSRSHRPSDVYPEVRAGMPYAPSDETGSYVNIPSRNHSPVPIVQRESSLTRLQEAFADHGTYSPATLEPTTPMASRYSPHHAPMSMSMPMSMPMPMSTPMPIPTPQVVDLGAAHDMHQTEYVDGLPRDGIYPEVRHTSRRHLQWMHGRPEDGYPPVTVVVQRGEYGEKDTYYIIPGGAPVIFEDDDGNEITRVGDFSGNYRPRPQRPVIVQDEYGRELCRAGFDEYHGWNRSDDGYYGSGHGSYRRRPSGHEYDRDYSSSHRTYNIRDYDEYDDRGYRRPSYDRQGEAAPNVVFVDPSEDVLGREARRTDHGLAVAMTTSILDRSITGLPVSSKSTRTAPDATRQGRYIAI
ncbi:hypothetical protein POSPLADRAFT_1047893 [Postia placenta MAD-698-R-SB12]|uniref:Uncharacterized protein n=1 Tax=Postia placenta MAD-698-R-SB12 TaxID=670580 RepID=A0A1X6MW56_9APHY|nr:hypothetical protein POSPLADRAFT_1047893 [Postia placenta MAD-698-R-SB12]OSX60456.1 hypothetical protein POSPLADRAFT_1047893 [Postia placenta MAD-698-R-SB12]